MPASAEPAKSPLRSPILALLVAVCGCGEKRGAEAPVARALEDFPPGSRPSSWPTMVKPGAASGEIASAAIARMIPTAGSRVGGTVRFVEQPGGLRVEVALSGLPPGAHTLRVHRFGDCTDSKARGAGPGFTVDGSSLRSPVFDPVVGILGAVAAPTPGAAATRSYLIVPRATVHGRFSILGRSVVVHGPAVDSGETGRARLACGVIGIHPGDD